MGHLRARCHDGCERDPVGKHASLRIRGQQDTGTGVAEADRERIFEANWFCAVAASDIPANSSRPISSAPASRSGGR